MDAKLFVAAAAVAACLGLGHPMSEPHGQASALPANYTAAKLVQINDNGAWSWFMDPRAIVQRGKLIVGSVRAVGKFANSTDADWGNVEVSTLDLASGAVDHIVLHRHFEQDDHDGPAFLELPGGRLLATYTKHGVERKVYYRISEPHDALKWGPTHEIETPGNPSRAFRGDNVTYSNLFRFRSGRIYDFFRGPGYEPNYMYSDDDAKTWTYGGHLFRGRGGYSPYFKFAFDQPHDTIHFVCTEDHPRNYDNSVYHGFIHDGGVYFSDDKPQGKLSTSIETELHAWDLTPVYKGDFQNVAWVTDLKLDAARRPVVLFTVHKGGRLKQGTGGEDHRFFYGRWDGAAWQAHEIAFAGRRLYAGEDDYTGLGMLDPHDTNVLYISTDADPLKGTPLISGADGKRHRELFRGVTADGGKSWRWEPLTANSDRDNLRPLVPAWSDRAGRTAIVWMRGSYSNNHGEWTTAVVAMIIPRRAH